MDGPKFLPEKWVGKIPTIVSYWGVRVTFQGLTSLTSRGIDSGQMIIFHQPKFP